MQKTTISANIFLVLFEMETTKRKEVEGRTKRGCSCTWMIWRMMIATRRTRLIRFSISEDNKDKV